MYTIPNTNVNNVNILDLIGHLEMLNVLVAIKVWCEQLSNKTEVIHCDNIAVVHVLQSGRGCDKYLLAVARKIWGFT